MMKHTFRSVRNTVTDKNFVLKLILLLIILSSFLLAVYNTVPFESVDEEMLGKWIWEFHRDPFPVNQYPPLFLYLHFILSLIYKAVFVILGIVRSGREFLLSGIGYKFMMDAGRIISAIFGMLMINYIYRIGREFYNSFVAVSSAVLLAFNGIFILHSHIFKTDILVSFLITVSLFYLFRFTGTEKRNKLFAASFFFGLAFSAKYNVALFSVILILAVILKGKETGILKNFGIIAAGALSGFIISAPNWIVRMRGNFRKLYEAYNFDSGSVYIQDLSPGSIYSAFISDIIKQFGIILFAILIAGIVISFYRKEKNNILLSVFLLLYILFFGLTGFYGNRFLLPVYPAIILLICKTIFIDLFDLIRFKKNVIKAVSVFALIPILYISADSASGILKRFNMLNLESKSRSALNYRESHNLNDPEIVFGSQHSTPKKKGDVRFLRNFQVKPYSLRRGKPDLLQVNAGSLKALGPGEILPGHGYIDLHHFSVFHRIEREEIQDWDNDILFLYRMPPELKNIEPGEAELNLPKSFRINGGDAFFPVQNYEKLPGFLRSESGRSQLLVSSLHRLQSIRISIYSARTLPDMEINVNGKKKVLRKTKKGENVREVTVEGFSAKHFHFRFDYSVEINPANKTAPGYVREFYAVVKPEFADQITEHHEEFPQFENADKIPELYPGTAYPEWVKEVYRKTAINIPLYDRVNTVYLEKSTDRGNRKDADYIFPLEQGFYLLGFKAETDSSSPDSGKRLRVNYEIISAGGKETGSAEIHKNGNHIIPFTVSDRENTSFLRISILNQIRCRSALKDVYVKPDLVKYFKN